MTMQVLLLVNTTSAVLAAGSEELSKDNFTGSNRLKPTGYNKSK